MFNNTTGQAILTGKHSIPSHPISANIQSHFLKHLGAIASTYTAGTAIGGLFSGWSAESYGRKKSIIVAAAVGTRLNTKFLNLKFDVLLVNSSTVVVGTTIQTAAQDVGMLIVGRVIAGLAVGVLLSIVPVYNAELVLILRAQTL
jgi:MFS family permease